MSLNGFATEAYSPLLSALQLTHDYVFLKLAILICQLKCVPVFIVLVCFHVVERVQLYLE